MRTRVRPNDGRGAGGVTRSGLATMARGPGLHRGLCAPTAGPWDGTTCDGPGDGGVVARSPLVVHPATDTTASSATTPPARRRMSMRRSVDSSRSQS